MNAIGWRRHLTSRYVPEILDPSLNTVKALRDKYGGVTFTGQELSGSVARAHANQPGSFNGVYTGVTLGQSAPPLGVAPLYDGINDYANIYTPSLASIVAPGNKCMFVFAKVSSASVWTDGQARYLFDIQTNLSGKIWLQKHSVNNVLSAGLTGASNYRAFNASGQSHTGIFMVCAIWDGDVGRILINGSQNGGTQTGMGTWTGAADNTRCALGCQIITPTLPWSGLILHATYLTGAPTNAEILAVAQEAGVA